MQVLNDGAPMHQVQKRCEREEGSWEGDDNVLDLLDEMFKSTFYMQFLKKSFDMPNFQHLTADQVS